MDRSADGSMTRFDKTELRGRWHDILSMLGVHSSHLSKKHGPCPFCGGKDRFRFTDKDGDGGWICNQCGHGDGASLAMRYLNIDFVELKDRIRPLIGTARVSKPTGEVPEWKRIKERKELWKDSWPIQPNDPVDKYLFNRLGVHVHSSELRTHLTDDGAIMVARVLNGHGNRVATLHRTFLTKDGEKIDRKMMSGKVDGDSVAVRLIADYSTTLGIAEGIETALSAWRLFGVPVWAALNEGNLRKWYPPEQITKVVIFGDNDKNFVGQRSAYECAHNCSKLGKQVEVMIPETSGDDWNDFLLKSNQSRAAA